MKNFFVVTNSLKDKNEETAQKLRDALLAVDPLVTVTIADMNFKVEQIPPGCELVLVIGGDGTVLYVSKKLIKQKLPLIGINLGAVGYLTEIDPTGLQEAAEALVLDRYQLEERMMLEGHVETSAGKTGYQSALNDIVITRKGNLQVVGYRIRVNGSYLNDFFADGVIISTPTGSTGYSMSAGGTIVEPSAKLMVLTPICPHTLNSRCIILSQEDIVEIEILPPKGDKGLEVAVFFDGDQGIDLTPGNRVLIQKSNYVTTICKLKNESFLEILHKKISE